MLFESSSSVVIKAVVWTEQAPPSLFGVLCSLSVLMPYRLGCWLALQGSCVKCLFQTLATAGVVWVCASGGRSWACGRT